MNDKPLCDHCGREHEIAGERWHPMDCATVDDVNSALWDVMKDDIRNRANNFLQYCFEIKRPQFCWICGGDIEGTERNCPHPLCRYRLGLDMRFLFDDDTITFCDTTTTKNIETEGTK